MRAPLLTIALAVATAATAPAQKPKEKPRYYDRVRVLCIGVENYKQNRIGPAKYSVNDAKKLGDLLERTYGYEVECLVNEDATGEAIRRRLEALCPKAAGGERDAKGGPKEAVIVYFAGHGIVFDVGGKRYGFLVPYDADVDVREPKKTSLETWKRTCIDMQDVVDRVEKCKAHQAIIIADACCSGFMTQRGDLDNSISLRMLLRGSGRNAVSATTEAQGARWDEARKHGVFTHSLIDALKHYKSEAASITDVFVRVKESVPARTDSGMLPLMSPLGRCSGEFVFLPLSITERQVEIVDQDLWNGKTRSADTRGLVRRLHERNEKKATLMDVLDASRAYLCPYDYSDDPEKGRALWAGRVEKMKENATLGDPLAMAVLHYCYAHKIGVEAKDDTVAYHYAQLARATGHPAGLHVMARCYALGIGVGRNRLASDNLTDRAARAGFRPSLFNVGVAHKEAGRTREADEAFEKAFGAGDYHAARPQVMWGRLYAAAGRADREPDKAKGEAIMKEAVLEAVEFLEVGRKAGCPLCTYELAVRHARFGDFLDRKKSVGYLREAARGGYGLAQAVLARELARDWWVIAKDDALGLGLAQDEVEAVRWAENAARQGFGEAHVLLANLYRTGSPKVPVDLEESRKRCDKAAELKHPCAYILQSYWHLQGVVIAEQPDENKAFLLAWQAALSKDDRAYLWLGDLYAKRRVPAARLEKADKLADGEWESRHHAMHYYILAATHSRGAVSEEFGLASAKERLLRLRKELQDEANQNLKEFRRKNAGNPKLLPRLADIQPPYWRLFRQTYPDDEKLFLESTKSAAAPNPLIK